MFQAWGSKRIGPKVPDETLDEFTAAVTDDDCDAVRALLGEHFPDRNQLFPGQYNIYELFPVISQAARNDQVDVLAELFVPYPFPGYATDFVAREAIDAGSVNTLVLLLAHGWDINYRARYGLSVLESVLYAGAPDRGMVMWLVAHGARLNERPRQRDHTGMSQAAEHAPPDLVRELLDTRGGDVRYGQLLHHALRRKRKQTSPTQSGSRAGSMRAAADDIVEMLGLLLERGAPLNLTMYANDDASAHHVLFVDLGTPLHVAAQMGHVAAVRYLLAQGADAHIVSTRSQTTALAWAEQAGHSDVVALLRFPDQPML